MRHSLLMSGILALAAAPAVASAQRTSTVPTKVGMQVLPLAALLDSGALSVQQRTPALLTARSRPVVRANTAWQLVALLTTNDARLRAQVTGGDGAPVALSAGAPRAVVASSSSACTRCEVPLSWRFMRAGVDDAMAKGAPEGRNVDDEAGKPVAIALPGVRYVVEPLATRPKP